MNEKIERTLRKEQYRIEDGGDGILIVLQYQPSKNEEIEIYNIAKLFYYDVQWCLEPKPHGDDAVAVLNCFYPVKLPFTNQEALRRLRELENKDDIEDRHAETDELISLYAPHEVRFAYSRINSEGK